MKYTWLILDADGTLLDFARAERRALARTPNDLEMRVPAAFVTTYEAVNAELWASFEQGLVRAQDVRHRRFQEVFRRLGLMGDPDEFSEAFLRNVIRESVFMQGAEQLLAYLRTRVGLLLLTNGFSDVQRARFKRLGLETTFDHVIISEEVGVAKPDREVFDLALARMGDPGRHTVLVVGDSLSSDILGGANSGLDTCWFNPDHQLPPIGLSPTYEIASLDELPGLLSTFGRPHG